MSQIFFHYNRYFSEKKETEKLYHSFSNYNFGFLFLPRQDWFLPVGHTIIFIFHFAACICIKSHDYSVSIKVLKSHTFSS